MSFYIIVYSCFCLLYERFSTKEKSVLNILINFCANLCINLKNWCVFQMGRKSDIFCETKNDTIYRQQ